MPLTDTAIPKTAPREKPFKLFKRILLAWVLSFSVMAGAATPHPSGNTPTPGRIYIGLMNADYAWRFIKSDENIVRYSWHLDEVGGATSARQWAGITPRGFIENGKYRQITLAGIDVRTRAAACDALRNRETVRRCYTSLANDLFPDLAPITNTTWFYDQASRRPFAAAVPASLFSGDIQPDAWWRSVALLVPPFWLSRGANEYRVPTTIGSPSRAVLDYFGDVITTHASAATRPLLSDENRSIAGTSKTMSPALKKAVTAAAIIGWTAELDAFKTRRLSGIPVTSRAEFEKNVSAARAWLTVAGKPEAPYMCVATPRRGRYARKLFVVGWGTEASGCSFNPANYVGVTLSPFRFSATIYADGGSTRVLRVGLTVKDELQFLQSEFGSVLETPQGDFFLYTESSRESLSQTPSRDAGENARVVIDSITSDGALARLGSVVGSYGSAHERPVGR